MPEQPTPPPEAIALQLFFGKALAMAASVACKLRIPDKLANGPRSVEDLAKETASHAPSLNRVLRALAGAGVFATDRQGRYQLTEVSQLLRTGVHGSMRGIIDYLGSPWSWNAWGDLLHSVRTGETAFNHVFGEGCFDHLSKHAGEGAVFNEGMTGFSTLTAPAVAEAYDFSTFGTIVDVGGGHGKLLLTILQKGPGVRGIVFDAPHVVEGAIPAIEQAGLKDRCRAEGGNFFQAVPAGGDAYMMKHIIHDWNDTDCATILRHCRSVIPATGRLLVIDMVVPPGDEPHPSKLLDLEMMAIASGQERTEDEFRRLFAGAGFQLTRIVSTKSPVCVVEGVPV